MNFKIKGKNVSEVDWFENLKTKIENLGEVKLDELKNSDKNNDHLSTKQSEI